MPEPPPPHESRDNRPPRQPRPPGPRWPIFASAAIVPVGMAWAAATTTLEKTGRDGCVAAWVAVAVVGTATVISAAAAINGPPRWLRKRPPHNDSRDSGDEGTNA